MNRPLPTIAWLLLCAVFFVFIQALISHIALSSFSSLAVSYDSDHADRFMVFYSPGPKALFSQKRLAAADPMPAGKNITAEMNLGDHIARRLRLDPGDHPGQVTIHSMVLTSHFGSSLTLAADDIYRRFEPNAAISDYRLVDGHLLLGITGKDPQLRSRDDLVLNNRFISIVLPLAFTLAFYLAVSHFDRTQFPAFYDLAHHMSSAHINYASLDGVRGIAVLLVLLDHGLGFFTGAGTAGVWIFFVLSGFLLAIPFVRKPEIAISGEYMGEYLLRRLKRIIPMYYFFIIVTFFLFGKYNSGAVRHLLFLQGDGHLWTIPQEMLFYLFLPVIMMANYVFFRGRAVWIVAALAVIMVLANVYLDKSVMSLYGLNMNKPAFVGIFICGILFSYLYHGVLIHSNHPLLKSGAFRWLASVTGLVLLVGFFLLPTDALFHPRTYLAIRHPGWFGLAAGVLIVLALLSPRTLYARLLSWTPLRALGIVGFSFYLLHPIVISLVKGMQDYYLGYRMNSVGQLFVVLIITYCLAAFTYSYIEHPFLKRAKKNAG
jgi:peptidoglycan/LPS O-acetylase OafA/YrhL